MVRVYLAATEAFKVVWGRYPYQLASYMYRRALTDEYWAERARIKSLMIDSGAHTYFVWAEQRGCKSADPKKEPPPPTDYTHDYCKWLVEHKKHIDIFVELDIDSIVGWKAQLDLRDIFESYNLDPLLVWHNTNEASFEDYCRQCDYIGISGIECDEKLVRKQLGIASRYGTKVHVFGYTRATEINHLRYFPAFYSCDSSNCTINASKHYKPYEFVEGSLVQISDTKWARKYSADNKTSFKEIDWRQRVEHNLKVFNEACIFWDNLEATAKGQSSFDIEQPGGGDDGAHGVSE